MMERETCMSIQEATIAHICDICANSAVVTSTIITTAHVADLSTFISFQL